MFMLIIRLLVFIFTPLFIGRCVRTVLHCSKIIGHTESMNLKSQKVLAVVTGFVNFSLGLFEVALS